MFIDLGHATIATLVFLAASLVFGVCVGAAGMAVFTRRVGFVRRLLAIVAIVGLVHTFALFGFAPSAPITYSTDEIQFRRRSIPSGCGCHLSERSATRIRITG
jgi:hypothetical protein